MVQQYKLKGHQGPVTCLAHSSTYRKNNTKAKKKNSVQPLPSCLLSGSEDGTVRLWDFKSSNPSRAALCIVSDGKQEITSVSFHPTLEDASLELDQHQYPFTVYASTGTSIYGYDLRQTSSPILQQHHFQLKSLEGGEEINEINMTTSLSNKKVYMGTADDDGYARVSDAVPNRYVFGSDVPSKSNSDSILLQHADASSNALVTSIAFRPRAKTLDVATGGTDSIVCLWDANRPKRPSSSFTITRDEEEGVNQICNPPFVNSLAWSPSGWFLAAGCGDGTAMVMKVEGRKLTECVRLRGGHDAMISSVLFPQFGGVNSSHVMAEDRLLVTAGNDGSIFLWDLGSKIVNFGIDPSTVFDDCMQQDTGMEIDNAMQGLSLNDKNSKDPRILMGLEHGLKPNAIESSHSMDPVLSDSLFVADTSNDITVYSFPRI